MKLIISFPLESFFSSDQALEFIFPFLKFEINEISSSKSFSNGNSSFEFLTARESLYKNKDISFSLYSEPHTGDRENLRITYRKDLNKHTEMFWFDIEKEENIDLTNLILESSRFRFSTACKFDFQKSIWQSEEFVSNYIYYKKSYDHLEVISVPNSPPAMANRINIFKNPGHQKLTYNMFLMAAPEMWFGPESLIYFEKQKLISFSLARNIIEIRPNIIFINLFDYDSDNYESEEILSLQRKFRDWTQMDEIETRLTKIIDDKGKSPGVMTETKLYK